MGFSQRLREGQAQRVGADLIEQVVKLRGDVGLLSWCGHDVVPVATRSADCSVVNGPMSTKVSWSPRDSKTMSDQTPL